MRSYGLRGIPAPGTPFRTFTVSQSRDPIKAGSLTIAPDYTFDDAPSPEIIVIAAQSGNSPPYLDYLRRAAARGSLVLSVCTGVRKIMNSTYITLDGAIKGPHLWPGLGDSAKAVSYDIQMELLDACDTILLGRHTYEAFATAWPTRSGDRMADCIVVNYECKRATQDPLPDGTGQRRGGEAQRLGKAASDGAADRGPGVRRQSNYRDLRLCALRAFTIAEADRTARGRRCWHPQKSDRSG